MERSRRARSRFLSLPFASALVALSACSADGVDGRRDELVASDQQELAAQDWSAPAKLARGVTARYNDPSIAFLGDTAYAVISGSGYRSSSFEVSFTQRDASGTWLPPTVIPGISAWIGDFRLTAFNGRLYLLARDFTTGVLTLSRYDTATNVWSPPSTLPFRGLGGLVAHDGKLVLMGVGPDYHLWQASMDATGAFSPAVTTPLYTFSGNLSLASWQGALHVFYEDRAGDVQHATSDGTTWSAPQSIPTGFGSNVLRGVPSAAAFTENQDCLHLAVFEQANTPDPHSLWWTYTCSGDSGFAVPVSLATVTVASEASITAGPHEMLVGYNEDYSAPGNVVYRAYRYPRFDGQACTTASQCASGVCTTSYADGDRDGFGAGAATTQCGPAPAGRVAVNGDCCDRDARARPGQLSYFTTPSACGGFDFDCNGAATQLHPPRATAGCTSTGSCMLHTRTCSGPYWTTANAAPACGASGAWRDCFLAQACKANSGSECGAYFPSTKTQACH